MRINQMVQLYQQQLQFQVQKQTTAATAATTGTAVTPATTSLPFSAALKNTQARLTDATTGVTQATKVRDAVGAVGNGLTQARDLVRQAAKGGLSATDRKKLQTDLTSALAAVDQGVKDQAAAGADQTLANKTFHPTQVANVAASALGQGASKTYGSVADLKKLDLNTATTDQLTEAAKVLDTAQRQGTVQLDKANAQVAQATDRRDTMAMVQNVLDGNAAANINGNTSQSQNLNALQALLQQQNSPLQPGSLINAII